MRKWNVVALVVALGLAPFAAAQQSDDDLRNEVEQLRRDLGQVLKNQQALEAENSALRGRIDAREQAGDTLEAEINALAESMDYAAATTVKSEANPITIHGEFRHRTGWTFDRDFGAGGTAGDDEGSFTQGRYRVGFDFDFDRDVTTRFSVQSAGNFGTNDLGVVRVYEAWIHMRNLFGKKELSARVGRQEIVLGNEFQFGNSDFFDGITHDGTHMMWESDNFNLHFIYARESSDGPSNGTNFAFSPAGTGAVNGHDDDELYSLYFTLKTIENHELDLYWIYLNGHNGSAFGSLGNGLGAPASGDNSKFGATNEAYYHTVGGRIGGVFPTVAAGLDWNVEVAYQFGSIDNAADTDVDGLAIEGEFGLTFNADNNFRIYARILYAEGADGDDSGYITLFPERHANATADHTSRRARYGVMNIIPMTNVLSIQAGLHFDPTQDWTLGIVGIWAEFDEDVMTPTGDDDEIGFEIDVFAEYRYSDQLTYSFGVGIFFPEDGTPLKGGGFVGSGDDDIAFLFYMQARLVF